MREDRATKTKTKNVAGESRKASASADGAANKLQQSLSTIHCMQTLAGNGQRAVMIRFEGTQRSATKQSLHPISRERRGQRQEPRHLQSSRCLVCSTSEFSGN